jgi:hypothetical protein
MSRIGFQATEADADICAKIARLPNLEPEGLFSHFACAGISQPEEIIKFSKPARKAPAFVDLWERIYEWRTQCPCRTHRSLSIDNNIFKHLLEFNMITVDE